jgi:hypothetical protein
MQDFIHRPGKQKDAGTAGKNNFDGCHAKRRIALGLAASNFGFAQQYPIDWCKTAGGGGTSAGGSYRVSGTIGQHDAGGPVTSGNYSLTGGFWALIFMLQPLGLPNLNISSSGEQRGGFLAGHRQLHAPDQWRSNRLGMAWMRWHNQ